MTTACLCYSYSTNLSRCYINLELSSVFSMWQISLCILKHLNGSDVPTILVSAESLGMQLKLCTFDTSLTAYLGTICIEHTQFKGHYLLASFSLLFIKDVMAGQVSDRWVTGQNRWVPCSHLQLNSTPWVTCNQLFVLWLVIILWSVTFRLKINTNL